jgi:hypothetical protein
MFGLTAINKTDPFNLYLCTSNTWLYILLLKENKKKLLNSIHNRRYI